MRNRAVRGCLIVVFAVCVILLENIGSVAKKSVKPQPNAQQSQQQPEADKRGTIDAPFIIKSLLAEKNQQEADDAARDKNDKRWNDRATIFIGIATAVILFLQLGVFSWQARQLRQTIVTMKELGKIQSADMQASITAAQSAADAAKKSAKVAEDALTVLEKPYVFIDRKIKLIKSIGETKEFKTQNPDFVCHIGVQYFIINHGRTPAITKTLYATMLIVANIPEHRTITGTPEIPPAIGMAQGIPDGPLMCLSNEAATVAICDEILRGDKFLFFYGQISYRDVFSYEYLTGFGWRYFVKANIWNPEGGKEYNFHMNVSQEPTKKAPFRF